MPNVIIVLSNIGILQYHKEVTNITKCIVIVISISSLYQLRKVVLLLQYVFHSHIFQNSRRLRRSLQRIKSLKREKREKRVTLMVLLMIIAFNISWSPYAFVCTLKLIDKNFVPDAWAVPGLLLAKR